jgi:hypothetical protein
MKGITALCVAVVICAVDPAHADWDSALKDCLSDHNKALHLRHRECFARELADAAPNDQRANGRLPCLVSARRARARAGQCARRGLLKESRLSILKQLETREKVLF